ncbi:hypothetical protein [Thermoclostridium stercorarium]|uniref:hypothetical protein n=1 Tax=Thermoclostridium stercorarium TaxID=1510 RepID=UPI0006D1E9F6|nr:hypothetical protein [Thermoclostridium stercorarium]
MRELVLTDLVKDVLGPRNGIYEIMNVSPRSEYITGILAPKSTFSERDPESENAFLLRLVQRKWKRESWMKI